MRLLLDTHIFLWSCVKPDRVARPAREAIADPANEVYVSTANAWEIAIKCALGRMDFPIERFEELRAALGFGVLDITVSHALAIGSLPHHHGDPFDRILIAQAREEGMALVTEDRLLGRYDVPIF